MATQGPGTQRLLCTALSLIWLKWECCKEKREITVVCYTAQSWMKIGHLFVLDISHWFRDKLLPGNTCSNSRSPINALPLWFCWREQVAPFPTLRKSKGPGILMAMVKHFWIQGSYRSFAIPQCKQEYMGWSTGVPVSYKSNART